MKLKFEHYMNVACIYVRGVVEPQKLKILLVGLDTLIKDHDDILIVHLGNAQLDPQETQVLAGMKKKMGTPKTPVYWVSPEKTVGDYKSLDLLANRVFSNPKTKLIADRIKLDDEVYLLDEQIRIAQNEIAKLSQTEENMKKIILDNDILKAQKVAIDSSVHDQLVRLHLQKHQPSDDPEIVTKTTQALEELKAANNNEEVSL